MKSKVKVAAVAATFTDCLIEGDMLQKLEKFKNIYTKIIVIICAVICTVILLVDVFQVLSRYVINAGFVFAEDVAVFGMLWVMALGISIGTINHEHLLINIIDSIVSAKGKRLIMFIVDIILILAGVMMTWVGVLSANANKGFVQSMLGIDEFHRYVPVIAGGVLTVIAAIECVIEQILRWKSETKEVTA